MKQSIAEWLIERDVFWMLGDNAPWWLLTHYPETNDVFTWLDGSSILLYIGATALGIGGLILAGLWLAGRILKQESPIPWHLGYALIPLAGLSIFLGLSALTVSMLKAEHINLVGIAELRACLLALAYLWSAYLLRQMIIRYNTTRWRKQVAWVIIMASTSTPGFSWIMMFYIW